MVDAGASMVLFEIDRGFIIALNELFQNEIHDGRLRIAEGDARKTLFSQGTVPDGILGNLPYNVGSKIIADLITGGFAGVPMVFTLQREVVERICAAPGGKEYGSFSILCQYAMNASNHGVISASSFYPAPEVQSGIVSLSPRGGSGGARPPMKFALPTGPCG
jgi:16S rRNA (adenine1518-N6/adenine1519-N6)-dimethyltransferase